MPVSATEWNPSESMATEPVSPAATSFATAIARLAKKAAATAIL